MKKTVVNHQRRYPRVWSFAVGGAHRLFIFLVEAYKAPSGELSWLPGGTTENGWKMAVRSSPEGTEKLHLLVMNHRRYSELGQQVYELLWGLYCAFPVAVWR